MLKIYFAGPDVFRPDYNQYAGMIRRYCDEVGLTPLLPGDEQYDDSFGIYDHNLELIRHCDGVIANLEPFRGVIEPDSGTVFECGFALALGKFVIGIVADQRDQVTKLQAYGAVTEASSGRTIYQGTLVEDFGQPLNLMLSHSLSSTVTCLAEALQEARKRQSQSS